MKIEYTVELVGGPYDGARVTPLFATGEETELPPVLHVGTCRGDGECNMPLCARETHPAFWLPEEDRPTRTIEYEFASSTIRDALFASDRREGTATYALGARPHLDVAEDVVALEREREFAMAA